MANHWTPPPGTQGLIFDCDGTLADTMPIHYRAWCTMLGRYGIPFNETRFYQLGGVPTEKIIQILSAETGVTVSDVHAMIWEKEELFLTELQHVTAVEPVVAVAHAYWDMLPMAVASGGYRKVVMQILDSVRVTPLFQAVVCAEDTEKHKPEPDVFLEAARRLGVASQCCVVFEDTDIGLEAARRADMTAVDIRSWL